MDIDNDLIKVILSGLAALTGGAAWVGRLQQRVRHNEILAKKMQADLQEHYEEDKKNYGHLERIDERTKNIQVSIESLCQDKQRRQ